MKVTIIADASWCPHSRVAGYGYWIASARGDEGGGGEMTTRDVVSNTAAEMMAVANALHHSLMSELVRTGDSLLIQTDCQAAIDGFRNTRKVTMEQERAIVKYVNRQIGMHALFVEYRHVKGHTDQPGARFRANALCDKTAKTHMRRARAVAICTDLKERMLAKD
jgi:ribonuclease HI